MRRTILMCVLFSVIIFSSCGFHQREAQLLVYSQILTTNDTLDKMTKEWHVLLKKAIATNNYTYLAPCRIRLAQFLSRNRSKVANLEVTPESENVRDSEEVFLANRATVISDVYPKFESNNDLTPVDVVQGQMAALSNDLENEISENEAIIRSLSAFAKKNNLNVPQ